MILVVETMVAMTLGSGIDIAPWKHGVNLGVSGLAALFVAMGVRKHTKFAPATLVGVCVFIGCGILGLFISLMSSM